MHAVTIGVYLLKRMVEEGDRDKNLKWKKAQQTISKLTGQMRPN